MVGTENQSLWTQMVGTLKVGSCEDKIDAYITSRKRLSQEGTLLVPDVATACQQVDDLLQVAAGDISSENIDLSQASLQLLGFCLYNKDISRHVTEELAQSMLQKLAEQITSTKDKTCCTRGLWVLSRHTLGRDLISKQVEPLVVAIEEVLCHKSFQSITVEFEGLNAIIRLLEVAVSDMERLAPRWGKLVYPLMLHGAPKVRERALGAMELAMPLLMKHQDEVAKCLLPDLKALLIQEMKRLMNSSGEGCTNQVHVLRAWIHYVAILGTMLHSGSLINSMLPIAEYGFKNTVAAVRCQAYHAWLALIDNFALDIDILRHNKRVKLLMQVFRISHARVESVAVEKQRVWWHFICKLKDHAAAYFEMVCIPLLYYSVHGTVVPPTDPSINPRVRTPAMQIMMIAQLTPQKKQGLMLRFDNNLASPSPAPISAGPSTPTPYIFRSVQLTGIQILAAFLGKNHDDDDNPKPKFTIEPLEHEMISGVGFFLKHAEIFITTTRDSIHTLGEDIDDGLLYQIWYSLVAHIKNSVETTSRREHVDAFSSLINAFRQIVCAQSLGSVKIMKLLQALMCLPAKALASSAYQVGTDAEIMQHSPLLTLLELLLHHRCLEMPSSHERLFCLLEKIVATGMNHSSGVLEFSQGMLALIGQKAEGVEDPEMLWRMWSVVAGPLLDHILMTNEVNQGDNLAYDFSCLHEALVFPCKYLLHRNLPQPTLKTLLKRWGDLSSAFSRLAAMVSNAEGNVWCEELCKKMSAGIPESAYKNIHCVESITQLLKAMEDTLDYSAFSNQFQFSFGGAVSSPFKFVEKRKRLLGNLASLVVLLEKVTTSLIAIDAESQKTVTAAALQIVVLDVIECHRILLTHVPLTSMVHGLVTELSPSLAPLYQGSLNKSGKMYSTLVMQKLERLWVELLGALQSRYNGLYDSELLADMSSLLAATFLHSRRLIKNQTHMFWTATFARNKMLEYPDNLKPVLARVKEKTPVLNLPGWDAKEVVVIEDTPASQMTQGESQAPLPDIVGLVSPHKNVGSFLNKAVSPNVKNSPLKACKSPAPANLPKRKLALGVDDMNTQDFVVIKTTPKKKRVLTEHQKDVMREKTTVPALYNNLDSTQDQSMLGHLSDTTQFSEVSTPDVNITSLPFEKSKITDFSNVLHKSQEDKVENDCSFEMMDAEDDSAVKQVAKEMADLQTKGRRGLKKKQSTAATTDEVSNRTSKAGETAKPKGRRKSVRFSEKSESDNSEAEKPQEKRDNKVTKVFVSQPEVQVKSDVPEAASKPELEVKSGVPEAASKPEVQVKSDVPDAQLTTQTSDVIVVEKPSAATGSTANVEVLSRRSRKRGTVASKQAIDDSEKNSQESGESSQNSDVGSSSPVKGRKTRSRSSGSQSPHKPSPPHRDLAGMQSGLQKWLQSTPDKKPVDVSVTGTPILAEETQDVPENNSNVNAQAVSVNGEDCEMHTGAVADSPSDAVMVEDTPLKDNEDNGHSPTRITATKNLFENSAQGFSGMLPRGMVTPPRPTSLFDGIKVEPGSPALSDCSDASGRVPVLKLHRLSNDEVAAMSPVKKDVKAVLSEIVKSDVASDGVQDMPPPVSRPKFGRRKSSQLIFSKAGQDSLNSPRPIGDLNLDDCIPSSQDSTGFGLSNSQDDSSISSEPFSEVNESKRVVNKEDSDCVIMNGGSEESIHVSQNPDIQPMDFASCDDSQATIITRRVSQNKTDSSLDSSSSSVSDSPVKKPRGRPRKNQRKTEEQASRDSSLDSSFDGDKPPQSFHFGFGPTLESKDSGEVSDSSEMSCASIDSARQPITRSRRGCKSKNTTKTDGSVEQVSEKVVSQDVSANIDLISPVVVLSQDDVCAKIIEKSQDDVCTKSIEKSSVSKDEEPNKESNVTDILASKDNLEAIFPCNNADEIISADDNETTPKVITKSCEKRSSSKAAKKAQKPPGKKSPRTLNTLFVHKDNVESASVEDNVEANAKLDSEKLFDSGECFPSTETSQNESAPLMNGDVVEGEDLDSDDLPLSSLNKSADSSFGDDVPLSCLLGKSQPTPGQNKSAQLDLQLSCTPKVQAEVVDMDPVNIDLLGAMTPTSMVASPVGETPTSSIRRKYLTKQERQIRKLSIDANFTSPNLGKKKTRLSLLAKKKSPKASKRKIKKRISHNSPDVVVVDTQSSSEAGGEDEVMNEVDVTKGEDGAAKKEHTDYVWQPAVTETEVKRLMASETLEGNKIEELATVGDVGSEVKATERSLELGADCDKENTPDVVETNSVPERAEELEDGNSVMEKMMTEGGSPHPQPAEKTSPPKKRQVTAAEVTPRSRVTMSRAQLILHRAIMNSKVSPPNRKKVFLSPRRISPREGRVQAVMSTSGSPIKAHIDSPDTDLSTSTKASPPPSGFRPIHLPRIYSPSASPSAGILRKRRLSGNSPLDSPSPPYKQRRVSFSDSIHMLEIPGKKRARRTTASPKPVNRCLEMTKKPTPPSPLVTVASKLSTTQKTFLTTRAKSSPLSSPEKQEKYAVSDADIVDDALDKQDEGAADSLGETQGSVPSSGESQLDAVKPLCPRLRDCTEPVCTLLPYLTTSTWLRGLSRLLSSKNISTVGDLCMMTEYDLHNLPIKSPKVTNLRKVISRFEKNLLASDKASPDTAVSSPKVGNRLPCAEDELNKLSPVKTVSEMDVSLEDSELILETSADLLDEIHRLEEDNGIKRTGGDKHVTSCDTESGVKEQKDAGVTEDSVVCSSTRVSKQSTEKAVSASDKAQVDRQLMTDLKAIRDRMISSSMSSQHAHHLGRMHGYLNDMVAHVFAGMQGKCPSPPPSPSSSQDEA